MLKCLLFARHGTVSYLSQQSREINIRIMPPLEMRKGGCPASGRQNQDMSTWVDMIIGPELLTIRKVTAVLEQTLFCL